MRKKVKKYSLAERNRKSFSSSFRKPQKKNKSNFAWICLILLFLILLTGSLLVFSGIFHIKTIEIEGLPDKKEKEIKEIVLKQREDSNLFFKQENLLFFNKNKLIKNLEDFNFSEITINKNFFQKSLNLKIQERKTSFIFQEDNFYFFTDKDSYIIKKLINCDSLDENIEKNEECLKIDDDFRQENLYPIIKNLGQSRLNKNEKKINLDEKHIDFSLKLYNDLGSDDDFSLKNIILDDEFNTIKAELENDLRLYFSSEHDYLEQISQFYTLKRDRENELETSEYIDLRYKDKIFYY